MRYELRTTFTLANGLPTDPDAIGRADRVLHWLYEYLPTQATMGCDLAPPRWSGNRYTEPNVVLHVVTQYRDVFALTEDRLRLERALSGTRPDVVRSARLGFEFEVSRVYGDAELVDDPEPTKKASHPC